VTRIIFVFAALGNDLIEGLSPMGVDRLRNAPMEATNQKIKTEGHTWIINTVWVINGQFVGHFVYNETPRFEESGLVCARNELFYCPMKHRFTALEIP